MTLPSIRTPSILIFALLSACGAAENDPGPGGVTVGEARALDQAAKMLDERSTGAVPLPPSAPTKANPEQPEKTKSKAAE